MAFTPITVTFNPPLINDPPATFDSKAFQVWLDLQNWTPQANNLAEETNTNATTAQTKAGEASASATLAENWATSETEVSGGLKGSRGYSQDAESSANASAAAANYKGLWSSLTGALSMPASVGHNGTVWVLNIDLADVTLSEPGVSGDWTYAYYPALTGEAGNVLKVRGDEAGVEWGVGSFTEYHAINSSGTSSAPSGAKKLKVTATAGGAGGNTDGSGGGAGGTAVVLVGLGEVNNIDVTVGAGGSAGGAGGSTIVTLQPSGVTICNVSGGSAYSGGGGSVASGGVIIPGGDGGAKGYFQGGTGGSSFWGGGGIGGINNGYGASPARCYGAGGGGQENSDNPASVGKSGVVILEFIA